MKFGGTSVGDASCIRRAAEIVRAAAERQPIVVVVSAMSGVTNRLIEGARRAEAGEEEHVTSLIQELKKQHEDVLNALVEDSRSRIAIASAHARVLNELERMLHGTALLRELTPRALDAISGIGERLSTPLLAGAITQLGRRSVPISATEVIITDSHHGRAEPLMEETHRRSETRLRPLLNDGVVPVVTGFIGSTLEGVQTTLGRGGSDY
jgi:aspartate kinase